MQVGDLLFVHVPPRLSEPLERAIQAVGESTIAWMAQRGARIPRHDTAQHVAMVVRGQEDGAPAAVVEAADSGVHSLDLDAFFGGYREGTLFFHGVVLGATPEQRQRAVDFALKQVGTPYASDFAPPGEEPRGWYCSSLVDYAYRCALGEERVFAKEPFPLQFEPRAFWEDYYRALRKPLPSHVGSNPTLLLHSSRVDYARLRLRPRAAEA